MTAARMDIGQLEGRLRDKHFCSLSLCLSQKEDYSDRRETSNGLYGTGEVEKDRIDPRAAVVEIQASRLEARRNPEEKRP